MSDKRTVLFLCTGNSCRSQMAEALLRDMAGERFEAVSAGSQPAGYVHPLAIEALRRMNISTEGARSKSWDEFADQPVDVVITVCDQAAALECPAWSGAPISAHWSLPDPAFHPGSEEERIAFAMAVANRLRAKIRGLIAVDWAADAGQIAQRLEELGDI